MLEKDKMVVKFGENKKMTFLRTQVMKKVSKMDYVLLFFHVNFFFVFI